MYLLAFEVPCTLYGYKYKMLTPQGKLLLLMCKLLGYRPLSIVDLSLRYQTPRGTVIHIPLTPLPG